MSKADVDIDYAKEFWSISNGITGFSIVQSLIFAVTIGPHQGELYHAVNRQPWLSAFGVITGTALYVVAIIFCSVAQKRLIGPDGLSPDLGRLIRIWWGVQMTTIVVFGAFNLLIIHDASAPVPSSET